MNPWKFPPEHATFAGAITSKNYRNDQANNGKGIMNMKKILATLLTVAMLLMLTTGFALAESYVYIKGNTNVRSGPGLGYSMVAQLNAGSTVSYLQQSSYDSRGVLWYRVSVGTNGGSGWVASTYANLTNTAGYATYGAGANTNSASSGASFWNTGVIIVNGDANVRSGPGLGYSILNTMFKGETATYLGSTSYDERGVLWYNVSFEGDNGWVSSVYASLTGMSVTCYSYVKGVSGDSNVRTGPGLGYKSIGTLHKGDTATYLGNDSVDERGVTWYNISFNGSNAWVSEKYTGLY